LDARLELRTVRHEKVAKGRVANATERLDPEIPRLPLAVGVDDERVEVRGVAIDVHGDLEDVPEVSALLGPAFRVLDEIIEQVRTLRDPSEVQRVVVWFVGRLG